MYPEVGKRCQGLKTTNMSNIHQTEQSAPVTFNSKSLDIGIGLTIYIPGNHQRIARSKFPLERFELILIAVHPPPIAKSNQNSLYLQKY